ncbi:hypothetical protein ADUPG1_013738 [Aduncisulcus paluster]|uniref:t-SNARE coiled-coil homology domain-containing protein n=1 Tax=Aduncisulcus paluster TaxID=2918883 RepID=A0ABQ5K403_9EUKA|nr:hypothetical protein ADUPG1_013738 [Aduncisulcus paluster]
MENFRRKEKEATSFLITLKKNVDAYGPADYEKQIVITKAISQYESRLMTVEKDMSRIVRDLTGTDAVNARKHLAEITKRRTTYHLQYQEMMSRKPQGLTKAERARKDKRQGALNAHAGAHAQKESLKKSRQMASEIADMGAGVSQSLKEQDEKLDGVREDVRGIESNLDRGEHIVRKMTTREKAQIIFLSVALVVEIALIVIVAFVL